MKTFVKIELKESEYHFLKDSGVFDDVHHEVKEVKIKDDYFKDDPIHYQLKTESIKAYKKFQEYEFKKRNNIPL